MSTSQASKEWLRLQIANTQPVCKSLDSFSICYYHFVNRQIRYIYIYIYIYAYIIIILMYDAYRELLIYMITFMVFSILKTVTR